MPKASINILGWNHRQEICGAIESALAQTCPQTEVCYMDNGSADGSADFVRQHYPQVKVLDNRCNLGYAGGHNRFFAQADSEFVMVLNPDVRLVPDFLEKILPAFDDSRVAAACGKLLRPGTNIIDSTGVIVSRSRRGRDRGQWEEDRGQYNAALGVFGVNGAAAVYRRSALEAVKVPRARVSSPDKERMLEGQESIYEYFDEDFFAYWEDVDLSWRLRLFGFKCVFVPQAAAFHERLAGQSPGGYLKLTNFIRHHRKLSPQVLKWNWENHLFCIIKNDFGRTFWRDLPRILARELAMLGYIIIFETRTLTAIPDFFRKLPVMLKKRRYIQSHKAASPSAAGGWFI